VLSDGADGKSQFPVQWVDPRRPVGLAGGRGQELTYLKSLMFGLSSTIPMERVLILQGEAGLGHDRLCDWTAAAAETEGLWVANLDALPGEKGGVFLERLVQDLISGLEADLYAASPKVRAMATRPPCRWPTISGLNSANWH